MKNVWDDYGIIRKVLTLFFGWLYFSVLMGYAFRWVDDAIIELLVKLGYSQVEADSIWRFYFFLLEILKALFGGS